jgi:hypothetical protein
LTKVTGGKAKTGLGLLGLTAGVALALGWAGPSAPAAAADSVAKPSSVWISCDDQQRVAYRVVPPVLNPHNAFTHPIKVHLKPGMSCADLK